MLGLRAYRTLFFIHFMFAALAPFWISYSFAPIWPFVVGHAVLLGAVWAGGALSAYLLVGDQHRTESLRFCHGVGLGLGLAFVLLHGATVIAVS
jgi:hypothetical protein